MRFCTLLMVMVVAGAASVAQAANTTHDTRTVEPLQGTLPFPAAPVPQPELRVAQAVNPQVLQLEEQVRVLNGRVEELTFQLLQLQEQLRKMQEDNDFRFQELEDQRGDAGPAAGGGDTQIAAAPADAPPSAETNDASGDGVPTTLGPIEFDADGNVVGSQMTAPSGANGQTTDSQTVAAIPDTIDADGLYRMAYDMILNGDYASAEAAFGAHVARFPDDGQTADAHYWLGEAQLGQNKFQNAAETFLKASRAYPNASKAPDMLLKLGVALVAMNNRDLGCEMFAEVPARYPDISGALSKRLNAERAAASC